MISKFNKGIKTTELIMASLDGLFYSFLISNSRIRSNHYKLIIIFHNIPIYYFQSDIDCFVQVARYKGQRIRYQGPNPPNKNVIQRPQNIRMAF